MRKLALILLGRQAFFFTFLAKLSVSVAVGRSTALCKALVFRGAAGCAKVEDALMAPILTVTAVICLLFAVSAICSAVESPVAVLVVTV